MPEDKKVTNRQALRDFHVLKVFEAGIQLFGSEVKSLRAGEASLKGSFARIESGEVILYNMHISPYGYTREAQDPLRPRKLLLHKSEIRHLGMRLRERGLTLVPLKVFFSRGYAKVELAVAKGKREYDKREAIKEKQARREIDRELYRRR
jgi:SsrA-binding protein